MELPLSSWAMTEICRFPVGEIVRDVITLRKVGRIPFAIVSSIRWPSRTTDFSELNPRGTLSARCFKTMEVSEWRCRKKSTSESTSGVRGCDTAWSMTRDWRLGHWARGSTMCLIPDIVKVLSRGKKPVSLLPDGIASNVDRIQQTSSHAKDNDSRATSPS
jgi:hypothetical protein